MSYNYIFSLATGHDGNEYYAELLRRTDGLVWDDEAGDLAAAPTMADSALAVAEIDGRGHYGVTLPDDLPVGFYRLSLRRRAGASPAATDDIKDVKDFQHSGSAGVL